MAKSKKNDAIGGIIVTIIFLSIAFSIHYSSVLFSGASFSDLMIFPCCQEEIGLKKIVMQKNSKMYDLNLNLTKAAIERNETENHLYVNMSWYNFADFIALVYEDYTVGKSKNPFMDSVLSYPSFKYSKKDSRYESISKSVDVETYLDKEGKPIFEYVENKKGQEFIQKLYPKFKGSRRKRGLPIKDDYIDITAFLAAKFNKKLSYTIDDEKELVILKIQDL